MADVRDDDTFRRLYWPYALGRAVAFSFLAIAITFSQNHSARLGLAVFAIYALLSAATGIIWWRAARRDFPPAKWILAQSIVSLVAAGAAVAFAAGSAGGIRSLLVLLAGWAAITGLIEAFLGMRMRRQRAAAGDWLAVGLWTMLAAIVFVLVPPDFTQQFVGEQKVTGVLDSSVVSVGYLGAYAAVAAVFLIIAALSARNAPAPTPAPAPADPPVSARETAAPPSTAPATAPPAGTTPEGAATTIDDITIDDITESEPR